MKQIIRNVALRGREGAFDVALEDDRIAAVEPRIEAAADAEHDGGGGLLVPGLVNAHQHLDKCMLGDVMRQNESQTLQEAIEITWDFKRNYTVEEIADRAVAGDRGRDRQRHHGDARLRRRRHDRRARARCRACSSSSAASRA